MFNLNTLLDTFRARAPQTIEIESINYHDGMYHMQCWVMDLPVLLVSDCEEGLHHMLDIYARKARALTSKIKKIEAKLNKARPGVKVNIGRHMNLDDMHLVLVVDVVDTRRSLGASCLIHPIRDLDSLGEALAQLGRKSPRTFINQAMEAAEPIVNTWAPGAHGVA